MDQAAPPQLMIGTSGWSYSDWKGVVYSAQGAQDPLGFMIRYFDALEINVSFYRDIPPGMAEAWAHKVEFNQAFRFTAKIHQRFTHQRGFPLSKSKALACLEGLLPLRRANRLGALLAQFPWSFRHGARERDWLAQLREAFDGWPLVIELRHDSWLSEEALSFLRSLEVGWCNIDQPLHGHCIPPTSLVLLPIGYVRLHGRNHAKWFDHKEASQRYDYLYTQEELDEWLPRIKQIAAQASTTFVFANNHYRGQAVANALELKVKLSGRPVEVPEGLLVEYPVLARFARRAKGEWQGRLF